MTTAVNSALGSATKVPSRGALEVPFSVGAVKVRWHDGTEETVRPRADDAVPVTGQEDTG